MYPSTINTYSLIHLQKAESTNNYAASIENQSKIQHKTVILASFQSKGKGQYNNVWQSEPDLNLLLSICLFPKAIDVANQFDLSRITTLAIRDSLSYFLKSPISIKWPNDIFVLNKKIAGVLIENILNKNKIERSIIGIGINVNQTSFDDIVATSFKNESDKNWDLARILEYLLYRFDHYLEMIDSKKEEIHRLFDLYLYKRKDWIKMSTKKLGEFSGRIIGTESNGMLLVEDEQLILHRFSHKEVLFN